MFVNWHAAEVENVKNRAYSNNPFWSRSLNCKRSKNLGYTDVKAEGGRAAFSGGESAIWRANVWLRTAA
jgi:23S rRNA G2445 N2-methylase RlmL